MMCSSPFCSRHFIAQTMFLGSPKGTFLPKGSPSCPLWLLWLWNSLLGSSELLKIFYILVLSSWRLSDTDGATLTPAGLADSGAQSIFGDAPGLRKGTQSSQGCTLGGFFPNLHCSDLFPSQRTELTQHRLHLDIPCLKHTDLWPV